MNKRDPEAIKMSLRISALLLSIASSRSIKDSEG
jgi:hypothetical protein